VDVQTTGCQRGKVAQWSYCVAGDFGALAGLTSTCPGAANLLHAWPHKTLGENLRCCFGATDHGRKGTLGAAGDLERTVEISQQMCRSRWRPWCRGLVVSLAVGRWLTPGVFGARRRRSAMRPVLLMMVSQ
jgi:hypothetical protein